jgi:hypothetical protein
MVRRVVSFRLCTLIFGLPLDPKVEQDVGRYTALYIPNDREGVSAATRLVPLRTLLGQRAWPPRTEVLERLIAYGRTHGAWDDDLGYVEGSLARVIEAVAGAPLLPSVKLDEGFLCGMEFDSLGAESRLARRSPQPTSLRHDGQNAPELIGLELARNVPWRPENGSSSARRWNVDPTDLSRMNRMAIPGISSASDHPARLSPALSV